MSLIALLPTDDFSGEDEYEDSEEDEVEFLFKHLTRSECPLRCITGGAVLSRFAFLSLGPSSKAVGVVLLRLLDGGSRRKKRNAASFSSIANDEEKER